MAYKTDTVDRAINFKITGEIVGAGDGIQTVFAIALGTGKKIQIEKNSV